MATYVVPMIINDQLSIIYKDFECKLPLVYDPVSPTFTIITDNIICVYQHKNIICYNSNINYYSKQINNILSIYYDDIIITIDQDTGFFNFNNRLIFDNNKLIIFNEQIGYKEFILVLNSKCYTYEIVSLDEHKYPIMIHSEINITTKKIHTVINSITGSKNNYYALL